MTLSVESLYKEFPVPGGVEVAVDSIDLQIEEGEFVSLVGPSGCGKTTTLRCIAGLETPSSGKIFLDGEDITDTLPHKRRLAMMFQNIALYPHMIVEDNISYPLKVNGVSKSDRRRRAEEAAEIMQIPELLDKYPGDLSGGQRQRAALARTIIQDPKAFLMDEPLSDLDAKLQVEIRKEIQRVHKRVGKPTLYVTHNQEEALTMSDRIFIMNDGHIEQSGSPDEVYSSPRNVFVASFIGNPSMNFMDGRVQAVHGDSIEAQFEEGRFEFPVEMIDDIDEGEEITVGFRPEDVDIYVDTERGDFRGEILLKERIGDRVLVTLSGPTGEIRGTVEADHPLGEEGEISFSFDYSSLHFFDKGSGDAIARGRERRAEVDDSVGT